MEQWQGAVESLVMASGFWNGKRVLLTGHTGFNFTSRRSGQGSQGCHSRRIKSPICLKSP